MHPGGVADRIELEAWRGMTRVFLPATIQHEQGGEEGAGLNMAFQGARFDAHGLGLVLAAIDDTGDQTLGAGLEGRGPCPAVTRFRLKFLNLRHFS